MLEEKFKDQICVKQNMHHYSIECETEESFIALVTSHALYQLPIKIHKDIHNRPYVITIMDDHGNPEIREQLTRLSSRQTWVEDYY